MAKKLDQALEAIKERGGALRSLIEGGEVSMNGGVVEYKPHDGDMQLFDHVGDMLREELAAEMLPAPGEDHPDKPEESNLLDILDQSIPKVKAALAGLNRDQLAELREAEVGGKTRKGVIDAIDEAMS